MDPMFRTIRLALPLLAAAPLAAQTITRESVDERGLESSDGGDAYGISADGRYSLVSSRSRELYVRDRATGALDLVNPTHDLEPADGDSFEASMTPDLRFVVFTSNASNLVPGDTNGRLDVFVRDRSAGLTIRASVDAAGQQGWGKSLSPSISADGRWVAFESFSALTPGDTNGVTDVYLRDLVLSSTTLVSAAPGGAPGDSESWIARVAGDGSCVFFVSRAGNLAASGSNGFEQAYARDTSTGAITCISLGTGGALGDGDSRYPTPSADGRFVAFKSEASNLVPEDVDSLTDVLVLDRLSGSIELASLPTAFDPLEFIAGFPTITPDGRFVAFDSTTDVVNPVDPNDNPDVFVRDRLTGAIECASRRPTGQTGPGPSHCGGISDDGRWVAFTSHSQIFVLGDTNGAGDAFVRDLWTAAGPVIKTYCTAKVDSAGCAPRISASGKASLSDPLCLQVTARDVSAGRSGLLVYGFAPASTPFHGGIACVAAPLKRTPVQGSGGDPLLAPCGGTLSTRFDGPFLAAAGLVAGAAVHAQYYYRDPGGIEPDTFGLSDGLRFVVWP